jgi:hypothetical protein
MSLEEVRPVSRREPREVLQVGVRYREKRTAFLANAAHSLVGSLRVFNDPGSPAAGRQMSPSRISSFVARPPADAAACYAELSTKSNSLSKSALPILGSAVVNESRPAELLSAYTPEF